jgi:thymidylate kinase
MMPRHRWGNPVTDSGVERIEENSPLNSIRVLSTGLREAGVDFCHWKSNAAIALSEAGINDLDLLVAESHVERAKRVLNDLGFVAAVVPRDRRVPGLTDYFGLDSASARLVQVQLHEKLVLGDDMTKNFRLPVESAYLASSRTESVLPVPAPEYEYVVFLLRMALKHCPLDAVLMGKGRLTHSERQELEFLEARLDIGLLDQIVGNEFPWLGRKTIDVLRPGLNPGASIPTRARVGRRVMNLLAPFSRRSRSADFVLRVTRRLARRVARSPEAGTGQGIKSLVSGGAVIAFIGGDGAGKSTAVEAVFGALASQLRVAKIHMGKPQRSLLTRVVRRVVRMMDLEVSPEMYLSWPDFPGGNPGPVLPLLNVMLARDRRRQALRARSLSDAGWIVLSDRYPVAELKKMDAPRNARIAERFPGVYTRLMARIENRYYSSLPDPDLRLIFRVPPEVAVSRRSEQDNEFVRERAREVAEVNWETGVVLPAEAASRDLHCKALGAVWGFLTKNDPSRRAA